MNFYQEKRSHSKQKPQPAMFCRRVQVFFKDFFRFLRNRHTFSIGSVATKYAKKLRCPKNEKWPPPAHVLEPSSAATTALCLQLLHQLVGKPYNSHSVHKINLYVKPLVAPVNSNNVSGKILERTVCNHNPVSCVKHNRHNSNRASKPQYRTYNPQIVLHQRTNRIV